MTVSHVTHVITINHHNIMRLLRIYGHWMSQYFSILRVRHCNCSTPFRVFRCWPGPVLSPSWFYVALELSSICTILIIFSLYLSSSLDLGWLDVCGYCSDFILVTKLLEAIFSTGRAASMFGVHACIIRRVRQADGRCKQWHQGLPYLPWSTWERLRWSS